MAAKVDASYGYILDEMVNVPIAKEQHHETTRHYRRPHPRAYCQSEDHPYQPAQEGDYDQAAYRIAWGHLGNVIPQQRQGWEQRP